MRSRRREAVNLGFLFAGFGLWNVAFAGFRAFGGDWAGVTPYLREHLYRTLLLRVTPYVVVPVGTSDNSPAIYRWGDEPTLKLSPGGTAEFLRSKSAMPTHSAVPPGTQFSLFWCFRPSSELLGYFHLSLPGQP